MITQSIIESAYTAMRTALGGAVVRCRHSGAEYQGTRTALAIGVDIGPQGRGLRKTQQAAIRLLMSEVVNDIEIGEQIEILESGEWNSYVIRSLRYDNTGATVLIEYGERFA